MSQENVDSARRAWDAYERGDLSAAIADLSADMVTYVAPPIPVSGTYHGPEGLLQLTLDWAEGFDELVGHAQEFFDAGDQGWSAPCTESSRRARAAHRSKPTFGTSSPSVRARPCARTYSTTGAKPSKPRGWGE